MSNLTTPLKTKSGRERAVPDCQEIRTPRLSLRPISHELASEIFNSFDPTVARYTVPQPPERIDETVAFITRSQASKQAGSELVVSIHRLGDGEFLGVGGLHCSETPSTPELGIWLKSAAHGNGFGKEAVVGMIQWAEANLDIEYFVYPVDRQNVPSRKIPESLGGKTIAERKTPTMLGNLLDIIVFAIPRQTTI